MSESSTRSTRQSLIAAACALFWERGYEATSPRAIMAACHAGQGSFYHFFPSKRDLAAAALEEIADDMIDALDQLFAPSKPALRRVEDWLSAPRHALAGCRLGRLCLEKSVIEDDVLRRPLVRYFKAIEKQLRSALQEAQRDGQLATPLDADELASMLLAVVQGGHALSRAHRDPDKLHEAVHATLALLRRAKPTRPA
jgi:TetR/AcrR family transcriptional repressor of nem operon